MIFVHKRYIDGMAGAVVREGGDGGVVRPSTNQEEDAILTASTKFRVKRV